jgi:hypothetical protein
MRVLIFILAFINILSAQPNLTGWSVVYGDEFDLHYGASIDEDYWIPYYPYGARAATGVADKLYFKDENLLHTGNSLKILIKDEQTNAKQFPDLPETYLVGYDDNGDAIYNNYKDYIYTGGMIWSKKKFKYGYYEIKYKAPYDVPGMWPALWLWGNGVEEIDILERFQIYSSQDDEFCLQNARRELHNVYHFKWDQNCNPTPPLQDLEEYNYGNWNNKFYPNINKCDEANNIYSRTSENFVTNACSTYCWTQNDNTHFVYGGGELCRRGGSKCEWSFWYFL